MPEQKLPTPKEQVLDEERYAVLHQVEDWLETPLLVLGFTWLILLVVEFIWGLGPLLQLTVTLIWVIFIFDFLLRFILAPHKDVYLRTNWLTAISLLLPALRIFRFTRALRLLRFTRATRTLRLVRVVSSINRGMRALSASMGRRGVGYVLVLTLIVILVGAAGIYAFERDVPAGRENLPNYGTALWWTAMLLTTIGSEYWPQTAEGRILTFILALYSFGVFGYITAVLASFFVGRDADNEEGEVAGVRSIQALQAEIQALRLEIQDLSRRGAGAVD